MNDNTVKYEKGAATFLDVLGWKGIWQQDTDAIRVLHQIIEETEKAANAISSEYLDDRVNYRGKSVTTSVLSISDTIALFTQGSPKTAIEIHAKISAWLLPYALERKIPLRGAISYGEYIVQDNIMLGYAVDEAASWHESTDWIGVILSPSAQMKMSGNEIRATTTYAHIPFKKTERNLHTCVDWTYGDRAKLDEIITQKGPHTPEIAPKYLNTLAFLDRTVAEGV